MAVNSVVKSINIVLYSFWHKFLYTLWIINFKKKMWGTSLVVQWLRLHAPSAGVRGSIPEQGTESDLLIDPAYLITDPARPNKWKTESIDWLGEGVSSISFPLAF